MIKRLSAVLGVLVFSCVYAAEVTEVADAFDPKNPYDINLNIQFVNQHHFSNIKREYNNYNQDQWYTDNNGQKYYTTDSRRVETLEFKGNPAAEYKSTLLLSGEVGLYKNLSVSFDLPFVLTDEYSLKTMNSDKSKSLKGQGYIPDYDQLKYNHKGVGDISFGTQWAPFDQSRGVDAFSWLLGLKVKFPTGEVADPEGMNTTENGALIVAGKEGGVGDGLFMFYLRTAVSKKYEVSEPYLQFQVGLPAKGSKTIIDKPKKEYALNMGSDFSVWEKPEDKQKITIRTDLEMKYVTKGNSYNTITDARWVYDDNNPFGYSENEMDKNKLGMEDPYLETTFMFKPQFKVAKFVQFGAFASVGYRHKHYLTNASTGDDGYIPGLDDENTDHLDKTDVEDKYTKLDGGRLIDEAHIIFGWGLNLEFLF